MKKAVIILACTLALLGCDSSERDKQGRLIAERDIGDSNCFIVKDYGNFITFKYVIVDKHEYLMSTHDRGIGIAHSPNCQCRK